MVEREVRCQALLERQHRRVEVGKMMSKGKGKEEASAGV